MIKEYVSGYTNEAAYCPFCGNEIYSYCSDGSQFCDECERTFYILEDDAEEDV